ncbi:MAG TPA: GNAT family N-acetyltransferase [Gemmatimonadales bacterium]|nr:GNAT family N-acetyltransferase [Gemmatimonadales bacterium]
MPEEHDPWRGGRLRPVTLEGKVVRLEPLGPEHEPALLAVAQDERIWRYTIHDPRTPEAMRAYVGSALSDRDRGEALPFVVFLRETGEIIGATRFHAISAPNRGLEIGFTWYAPRFWRTRVNTECKYLLLSYAFDRLGCIRVELKTDSRNDRSRNAILRLGAVEEGTLRSKVIMRDGHRRNAIYFSILDHEWPGVKQRLEGLLDAP